MRSDNEDLKRRSNYHQREYTRTQQRNVDQSRQIRFLLKEIQEIKGGCVVPDDGDSHVSSSQVGHFVHIHPSSSVYGLSLAKRLLINSEHSVDQKQLLYTHLSHLHRLQVNSVSA